MNDPKHFHKLSNIKTIIVGVDLTEDSKNLVEEAQWLSKHWGAGLVLVNVRSMDPYVESGLATLAFFDEDFETAKREVKQFYKTAELPDLKIEVVFGDPAKEIDSVATRYPNSLIFVGHSNKSKWEKFVSGSAARKLAGESHSPMLIY